MMPIQVALRRAILAGAYPIMVGIMALVITISMTVPFASILIGAVLLRRDQWKEIVAVASLGSATGGVLLYLLFHHLGWNQIVEAYPELTESRAWTDATAWVSDYGPGRCLGSRLCRYHKPRR
jgi:membrane protein YqaA with SNARE-associated domain